MKYYLREFKASLSALSKNYSKKYYLWTLCNKIIIFINKTEDEQIQCKNFLNTLDNTFKNNNNYYEYNSVNDLINITQSTRDVAERKLESFVSKLEAFLSTETDPSHYDLVKDLVLCLPTHFY